MTSLIHNWLRATSLLFSWNSLQILAEHSGYLPKQAWEILSKAVLRAF
jgi:hypothetical protein